MNTLRGDDFKKMIAGGVRNLDLNRSAIDDLNVFPVPDGDTGTNMSLTINSALRGVNAVQSDKLSELAVEFSKGALKGARGNSGVILSQILKGFAVVLADKDAMTTKDFAEALVQGTEIAYSAVTKPKEGTILTVVRVIAEVAASITKRKALDFEEFFPQILQAGKEILYKTPEMLPVLKKANVVDAGGMGLLTILTGFYNALMGVEMAAVEAPAALGKTDKQDEETELLTNDYENITFAYCTEFFVTNMNDKTTLADIDKLRDTLLKMGDCVLCLGDLDLVKVHVHTNTPDAALKAALKMGELTGVKIENMLEQHRALMAKKAEPKEKKPMGLVAISAGKGLDGIFKDLGCDFVVEGGQSMNPSVYDILNAIKKTEANHVFILPNNSNIILAAEQAKELADATVTVIPTKNIPQGIAAALAFDKFSTVEQNTESMNDSIKRIKTAEITYAVKNTRMNGFSVKVNDIIGINDKRIVAVGDNRNKVVKDTIGRTIDENIEMITLYYGEQVSEEEANALLEELNAAYPDLEFAAYFGGQPHYFYLISME
ncbi:MAG: DAK2 domain-containing protein [Clostridiales bacterium]|nr:DAK2 domain-containing protein [Clostridiales bacterium]